MNPEFDIVVRGGLVLPMVHDHEAFVGDVLISEGRVVGVVRGGAPEAEAATVINAAGMAVLPGLIQGHVHVVQSLLRHQADELELLDWLRLKTWPYEAALDGDGVEAAAELGIAELLCGGTTCALDFGTTHDHDRVFRAADRMGIRFVSGKTHMDVGDDVPSALIEDVDRSLSDALELGRHWHGASGGRLRYAVAPRFALSCSRELLEGCTSLARDNGWMLQTHASENRDEVAAVREATGLGNIAYLESVGLVGRDVVLAHGVWLDDDEIEVLATSHTRVCHCPGANLKLASGIADIPRLRTAGVRVMLGADGPPCNNRLSVFHEMSLAATIHGLRHGPRALSAWDALAMATRTASECLGLDDDVGTLEAGKAADLIVVDLGDWSMLPGGDPASRLVYGAGAGAVRDVVVDGRAVVIDRQPQTFDPVAVRARIATAWTDTVARMEES
jgi:cytosine/adenosine deaminase-related metal-dependent hydrolase